MRAVLTCMYCLLLTPAFAQNSARQITLEDIWRDNTFRIQTVPGFNAMKDGRHYTQLNRDSNRQSLDMYDLLTGAKQKMLLTTNDLQLPDSLGTIESYAFSADEQRVLLFFQSRGIYRRSILHTVWYADLNTRKALPVANFRILHAQFSPDGSKVAFVKDNNLFYKELVSGKITQVTTDGERNKIINGNCDWVYEEEFGFSQAYQWSPDGKYLAFYRFDESAVAEYTITKYDGLYPTQYTYKYPKAGEANSVVQVITYRLSDGHLQTVPLYPQSAQTDSYVPRIKWTHDAGKLCIYRLNRHQDILTLVRADAATGALDTIYRERNDRYINISDNIEFLPDGHSFLFNSERDGWNHLYAWNWKARKLTMLTTGKYDVDQLVSIDSIAKLAFYTAAVGSPMERKLYAVKWSGKDARCLTPEAGTHTITPCTGNHFFLDKYATITTPPVYYLRDESGNIIRTLEDNAALKAKLRDYDLGKIKLTTVAGANGEKLNAWMITPPHFDSTKKYPLLMFQYSGPNSQQVLDDYPAGNYWWHEMLAQRGYIIVCVDGTGTGFRGEEFRKKTYLQLGKLESDDQIAAAKNLGKLPFVDASRIGIWGWSYGGFMSATCLFKGNDVFKMAISVAPVTNWRYYDNIYTERYMRTPAENEKGYDENAPETMAEKLRRGKLLLIHGTGDDNVHFQNSAMLVNNLIKAGKEYDSEYYPDRTHGISGGNTRLHLYSRMTKFVLANL